MDKAAETTGVYTPSGTKPGVSSLGPVDVTDRTGGMGAYLTFDTTAGEEILLKMGFSFKSVQQAQKWLEEEIPAWDYDTVRAETERQWNQELNKIVIGGDISETDKQLFYTAVYHAHLMPRDRTGDFEQYGSADMIDDHFALWDTWRTLYPLYTITNPDIVAKTVNSFIARARVNGSVRDSFVAGVDMIEQQGGDNVDNVIAEAYLKGIEGINWNAAYKVIRQNAEDYRLDWQGWGKDEPGDSYYKRLGWIPGDVSDVGVSTCSYALEYAYNDYCAAQMAKGMGDTENYNKWLKRSENWMNIWNPDVTDNGYSGFIWPKAADGSWISDSGMRGPGYWQGSWSKYFYESTSWAYSFFMPHAIPQLIEKMGGEETFCSRLMIGLERGWINFDNEPAFLAPYLFAYTGKPYLTTDSVTLLRSRFNLKGVPGNDDSGAMSSWYIFSSIGFFPNAGQNLYYFTSPRYPETTIRMDSGKTLRLIANNLSDENRYIQSITINGKPYKSTMFTHDVITAGGEIVFEMGSTPVDYAKETTANITVAEVGLDAVYLDGTKCDERLHLTALDQLNRSAGAGSPALAPEGVRFTGEYKANGTLGSRGSGFLWTNGVPTASSAGSGACVWSDSAEFSVTLEGDAQLELYVAGSAVLEVFTADRQKLEEAAISGTGGGCRKVSLRLGCGRPETFSLRLTPAASGANARVSLAAATLQKIECCIVSFDSMGGGAVPNQTVERGGKISPPKAPEQSGYSFSGWYADDALTIPWDFEQSSVEASLTLYAGWKVESGVFIGKMQNPDKNTVIDLSGYRDWIHFGDSSHDVIHCDRKNLSEDMRAFGSVISVNGLREENEHNANQPFAFTWSDGTPTAAQTQPKRYFSWARDGLEMAVTVPAGAYRADLYLSGIRSRATIEILNADRSVAAKAQQLWSNTGETRQFRVVPVQFHSAEKKTYIIRMLVDLKKTEPENYSMAIAAATLQKSVCSLSAESGENGTVRVRGGAVQNVGETAVVTATPQPGYQFAGWEVVGGQLTLENPIQNPLRFSMPDGDVTLRAAFTELTAAVKGVETIATRSTIDLAQSGNADWAYLGKSGQLIQKANVKNSAFSGAAAAVKGDLSHENMDNTNPDSPYFNWTGGTPEKTGDQVREIVWSGEGIAFGCTLQPGQHEMDLYLSSVRTGVIAEVLNEEGQRILAQKLWNSMGDYRPYEKVTLLFNCKKAEKFTIRLLVDQTDIHADWYSVSLYAAAVRNHTHSGEAAGWYSGADGHWHQCLCGEVLGQTAHTSGDWILNHDGKGGHKECLICRYVTEAMSLSPGDVDGDGAVTVSDVVALRQRIVSGVWSGWEFAAGNLDGDNLLTVSDVVSLRKRIVSGG